MFLLSVFPGGVTRRAAVNCRRTLMEKERCRVKTKTHWLRRFLGGVTALATVAMMLPTAIFASEGEYTAPAEWATVTVSGDMWEQDVIITYTIPEGTDYSKINFPIFNSDENGFNLIDQNGNSVGRWTWQPSDSADITIRVIDETEKYTYQSDSLQVGTKDLDVNNPREVVNRSYNPALYSLIKIENTSGGANNDVEDYLTDEVLATLLVEASYGNGIEDLDDFYCDYYNVDSLDQLDSTNLTELFSGRYNGGFSGMYDAIGANEANSEVIEIGWKNLYTNLFTLNEIGLLNYRTGSEFLSSLDDTFATSVTSNNGVTVHVEIDGEKTTDCYQAHDIYFGLEFSMTQPEPEPEPSEPSSEPSSEPEEPPVVIPDADPSLSIRKVWVEDTEEDRPDSILVEIYHDEELYDTVEVEEKYRWRTSYYIPERYENDDWWVQEPDVPEGYEDYIDETRDNVFVITNTYVGVEEESSEESSEPSVTPSEPSVGPSEPSSEPSEPTPEPEEPAEPTLPQTGQVWWPIIILLAGGAVLVAFGAFRTMRGNSRHGR